MGKRSVMDASLTAIETEVADIVEVFVCNMRGSSGGAAPLSSPKSG
jgi:hypothetical protein